MIAQASWLTENVKTCLIFLSPSAQAFSDAQYPYTNKLICESCLTVYESLKTKVETTCETMPMAPVFPLAKLAFLFVKQVARPLSSSIRRRAVRNVSFREYFCLPPARLYHWCEVRMKMYVMNLGITKNATIPKLNEDAAIELGANLLGEGVIFGVAVVILAYEVNRQKEKEKKKEEDEQNFINSLENRINELTFTAEELDTKVRELTRLCYATSHELKAQLGGASKSTTETSAATGSPSTSNSTSSSESTVTRAVMDARAKVIQGKTQ